jgi:hypothetical protein
VRIIAAFVLVASAFVAQERPLREIAITFDDLPLVSVKG